MTTKKQTKQTAYAIKNGQLHKLVGKSYRKVTDDKDFSEGLDYFETFFKEEIYKRPESKLINKNYKEVSGLTDTKDVYIQSDLKKGTSGIITYELSLLANDLTGIKKQILKLGNTISDKIEHQPPTKDVERKSGNGSIKDIIDISRNDAQESLKLLEELINYVEVNL